MKENAEKYNKSFEQELYRVMIHGILHLLGMDDKTEDQKSLMREKEEACLSLLKIYTVSQFVAVKIYVYKLLENNKKQIYRFHFHIIY